MSLFPEITSNDYKGFVEGFTIEYKYFINTDNQWWYCFDNIVEFIHMNEKYANMLYDKEISEENKMMVEDWNNYNSFGEQELKIRRFVTSDVVRQFIQRNNNRNNALLKSMNNLEFKEDAHEKYFEDEELVNRIEKLHKSLHDKDYEIMADQIYELYHCDSTRELLDKYRDDFDKELEKAVDLIRDKMYNDDINWLLDESNECIKLSFEDDIWSNWF